MSQNVANLIKYALYEIKIKRIKLLFVVVVVVIQYIIFALFIKEREK